MTQQDHIESLKDFLRSSKKIIYYKQSKELNVIIDENIVKESEELLPFCESYINSYGDPAQLVFNNRNDDISSYYEIDLIELSEKYKDKFFLENK